MPDKSIPVDNLVAKMKEQHDLIKRLEAQKNTSHQVLLTLLDLSELLPNEANELLGEQVFILKTKHEDNDD